MLWHVRSVTPLVAASSRSLALGLSARARSTKPWLLTRRQGGTRGSAIDTPCWYRTPEALFSYAVGSFPERDSLLDAPVAEMTSDGWVGWHDRRGNRIGSRRSSMYDSLRSLLGRLRLRDDEKGQGMVEYALILVLIAIVVIVIIQVVGQQVNNVFSNVSNGLSQ